MGKKGMNSEVVLSPFSELNRDDSVDSSSNKSASGSWSPKSVFQRLSRKLSPSNSRNDNNNMFHNQNQHISKHRELQRVFYCFDEDEDGKISPSELQSCLKAIGSDLSTTDAEEVISSTDSDGDGLLGFDDFVKLMTTDNEEEDNKDLRDAFRMYEMEGSGTITPLSLKKMLMRLGEKKTIEECEGIICMFDLNSDGVLSFEEFRTMMR